MSQRTYVVGDIHGRLDLLTPMMLAIADHAESSQARIVFLGDYVDRGPQSREVVEIMMALDEERRVVCLKGNHEDMMLKALLDGTVVDYQAWVKAGGNATLRSYGAASREDARDKVPQDHLRWMAKLPMTSGDGHRVFVHAGLAPGVAFNRQRPESYLWIREKFLRAPASDFDTHVVHGHTPQWARKRNLAEPELLDHRTNLDTGAYATGVLTAGVFDPDVPGGPLELIFVRAGDGTVSCQVTAAALAKPERRPRFWRKMR